VVATILASIPAHNEQPLTVTQITNRVAQGDDKVLLDDLEPIVATVLVLLDAFDAIWQSGGRYRCRAEMSRYFLHSVGWYIANARPILNNWTRRGVGEDLSISGLLDAAPYLLKLIEDRRFRLAGSDAEPTRVRHLTCVLVKTVLGGQTYFLFDWDRTAAQYQLIGGRIYTDEEPQAAAMQEAIEKLFVETTQKLVYGRDFDITPLDWDRPPPLDWVGVSRTVGALTRYAVWPYGMHLNVGHLKIAEHHRWLSTNDMLTGSAGSSRSTGDPSLYRLINTSLTGGFERVPISIPGEAIADFRRSGGYTPSGQPAVFVGHGNSLAENYCSVTG
jgi:hypothetical protein